MKHRRTSEQRRALWMILGLLAIPVATVSATALLADVASTTDPAAAAVGIPATLAGAVTGALVFRMARVAHSGAVALSVLLASAFAGLGRWAPTTSHPVASDAILRPAFALVPARVGRRGPPASRR